MTKLPPKFEVETHYWDSKEYDSMFVRGTESNKKGLTYFQWLMRSFSLTKFILRTPGGYDLYHIANPTLAPLVWLKRPAVATVFDLIPYVEKRSVADYFLQLTDRQVKYCDKVICVSESSKRDLLHFVDVNPAKVRVIYCGVDHDLFRPRSKVGARRRLGLPVDKPIILYVGSDEARKNVPTLMRAFAELLAFIPDALLVMVRNRSRREVKLTELFNLGHNVLQFKATVEEVAYFYNAADVFCFPSYYEGFGLPPLEAMSSGCAVVASCRTSVPEVLGDAGILIDPFDENRFTFWMRELLLDEDLRREIGQKCLKRSANFSWEKCATETFEVYNEVLDVHH